MAILTCTPASLACRRSCIVTSNLVSGEYSDEDKPWFNDVSSSYFSKCFNMWLQIICSSILHGTDVRETGRGFFAECLSPFLIQVLYLCYANPKDVSQYYIIVGILYKVLVKFHQHSSLKRCSKYHLGPLTYAYPSISVISKHHFYQ